MRVLIRQRSTARFLGDRQEWVPARERGLDFVSSVMARDVANRLHLEDVEVISDVGVPPDETVRNVADSAKSQPRITETP